MTHLKEHKLMQIWFFLLGELWLSSLPYSQTCCWELGAGKLLFVLILGNMMEAGAVLLLLLLQLGTLCVTSDANFYGNSVNFMAQKRNKDGTFKVGRNQ